MKTKQNLTIPKGTELKTLSRGYYCNLTSEDGTVVQFITFSGDFVDDHPEMFGEDVEDEPSPCEGCKNIIDCPSCVNGSHRRIA